VVGGNSDDASKVAVYVGSAGLVESPQLIAKAVSATVAATPAAILTVLRI